MADKVNRSASFRSMDRRSADGVSRSMSGGGGGGDGAEKFFQMKRGGARTELDAMSETSSQQERKFAALLGGPDPHDLLNRGGGAGTGPMNVGKRLYLVGVNRLVEKEERLQNVREQILMREMSEMTQRPAITRKARQKEPKGLLFAEHGLLWVENKQKNLEALKETVKAHEVYGMQAQPNLDRNSIAIVDRLAEEYQGPVSGWENHFAKFCSKKTAPSTPRDLFQPTINSNAVRVDIEKEIGDRLFEDSALREMRRRTLEKDTRDRELIDPNTGHALFSPQRLDASRASEAMEHRSPQALTDALLEEGKRIEKKKEELVAKTLAADPNLTFSPSINKRSSAIAQSVQRKPLHLPRARTSDGADQASPVASGGSVRKGSSGGGGLVATSANSAERRRSAHADPNDFFRRSELSEHLRQQKLEELQRNVFDEERRECSFQPRINRRSYDLCMLNAAGGESPLNQNGTHDDADQQQYHRHQQGSSNANRLGSDVATHQYNNPPAAPFRQPAFSTSAERRPSTPRQAGGTTVGGAPKEDGSTDARIVRHSDHSAMSPTSGKSPRMLGVADGSVLPRNVSATAVSPATGKDMGAMPHRVDAYVSSFEQQMFQVLDEWRKIEDTTTGF